MFQVRFDSPLGRVGDQDAYELAVRLYEDGKAGRALVVRVSGRMLHGAPCKRDERFWSACALTAANLLYDDALNDVETNVPVVLHENDLRGICRRSESSDPLPRLEPDITVLREWQ